MLYREAFPDDRDARVLLDARLLLADGHLEEVLLVLDGVSGVEAALLRLVAVAGASPRDAWGFLRAAAAVVDAPAASPLARHQAWALVARVASARGEHDRVVRRSAAACVSRWSLGRSLRR